MCDVADRGAVSLRIISAWLNELEPLPIMDAGARDDLLSSVLKIERHDIHLTVISVTSAPTQTDKIKAIAAGTPVRKATANRISINAASADCCVVWPRAVGRSWCAPDIK